MQKERINCIKEKAPTFWVDAFVLCGATRNRTGDTRIFSPLLYQLSYGTVLSFAGAKVRTFFGPAKRILIFFEIFLIYLLYFLLSTPTNRSSKAQ